MHGFAQRVLPLPAEPEALSQADHHKREPSRRLRRNFGGSTSPCRKTAKRGSRR